MGSVFVFDEVDGYDRVDKIRNANQMPPGAHFVASVTGKWKVLWVVDYDDLQDLAPKVEGLTGGGFGDPETAPVFDRVLSQVKRSVYASQMAFVRIDVDIEDPRTVLTDIEVAIGSDEVDPVVGSFDVLACPVADDDVSLGAKIRAIRAVNGVKATNSLRVIDFVSESEDAPDGHRIPA
jgi:hypothetical protein